MAKKKVLVILGSPRKKGGSTALARHVAAAAEKAGAKVTEVRLQDLDIRWCTACEGCHGKKPRGCVIKDDMRELYPKLREADAYVFASPIYFFTISAQLKTFIDRTYALFDHQGCRSPFKGKRFGLAFCYGGQDPFDSGCVNAIRTFEDCFDKFLECKLAGMVYGSSDQVAKDRELRERARELGRLLAE